MSLDRITRFGCFLLLASSLVFAGCGDDDDDDDTTTTDGGRDTGGGDTGGGDTGGGDGGPMCSIPNDNTDQCIGAMDMAAIIDEATSMQKAIYGRDGDKTASEVMGDCAIACLGVGASCATNPDRCARGTQLNNCLRTGSLVTGMGTPTPNPVPVTETCAQCFVLSAACAADNCINDCVAGASRPECISCRCRNHCFDIFESCSGLPASTLCEGM